jgi:hypothetical protein
MPFEQIGPTPHAEVPRVIPNTTGQVIKLNDALTKLSVITQLVVISRTTATAPGSPDEGDAYIMPSGTLTDFHPDAVEWDICFWSNGWNIIKPYLGYQCRVGAPELGLRLYFIPNTGWVEDYEWGSAQIGVTASTTQAQGEYPLTHAITMFTTVASANDACTLPADPRVSRVIFVLNFGANTLQVFPAEDHVINGQAADASVTVAAATARMFMGISATEWVSFVWSTT